MQDDIFVAWTIPFQLSPVSTHLRCALAFSSGRRLLKDQLDRNIATNGVGVGTDRVGKRDQFFAYGPLDSRQLDMQPDLQPKSTPSCRSNPDVGGDHRGAGKEGAVKGGSRVLHLFSVKLLSSFTPLTRLGQEPTRVARHRSASSSS